MKKGLLILFLNVLGLYQAMAQENEYIPFVREGVKWVCFERTFDGFPYRLRYFTLEFKGEKEIGGKIYKAMHKYSGNDIDWQNDTIPVYMREEGRVVYGIVPDGKTYSDCPVGNKRNTSMMEKIAAGEEFVWLDFDDPVAFIEGFANFPTYKLCNIIPDEVMISGKKAKRYIFYYSPYDMSIVEGIGFDGMCNPICIEDQYRHLRLSQVIENGNVIYNGRFYIPEDYYAEICDMTPKEWMDRYDKEQESIPYLVREGVRWVNEHVIVDHGDTTRNYYSYEFRGKNSRNWAPLYCYTGDSLDIANATIVAKAQDCGDYDRRGSSIPIWGNLPMQKTMEEGRSMFAQDGHLWLYSFSPTDISYFYTPNFYMYNQVGELSMSRQNFVEMEPLEIDGYTCVRFAYIDEQGEPLAYIVDGIGFDSRDMGDLLTPFTRKPDPDAEHQELWGLSHVVKDGKIIYKGMCFDPKKFGDLKGDINADGLVNITDVTLLINMLINGNSLFLNTSDATDVNSDGRTNITDVTTLINYLLNH